MDENELIIKIKLLDQDTIKYVYWNNKSILYKLSQCPYCNRICNNSNSLMSHLRYHKEFCNTVGIRTRVGFENVTKIGRVVWNKGLDKTNLSIKNQIESCKLTQLRKFGGPSLNYWYRTDFNNDPNKYPEYYISDQEIIDHNNYMYEKFKENYKRMLNSESGRMRGWHSYPEELLGDILFLINIHYEREYNIYVDGYVKYRVDYYIPEFDKFIECDGDWKYELNPDGSKILNKYYLSRSREIEKLTGKSVININSNSIFYYYNNKKNLYRLLNKPKYELVKFSPPIAQW